MSDLTTRVFISYKTGAQTGLTFQARAIKKELEVWPNADYQVFLDKESIEAGLDWNRQIYEAIPLSDVLLLLLAPETANSDWVRREIDVAKGAQVTILPVLIRQDFDLQGALDEFDIPRVQAVNLLEGSEEEYKVLFEAIEERKADTRAHQRELLERAGRTVDRGVADADQDYAVFPPSAGTGPSIHLAAGDVLQVRGVDVFVNSENDYMQMARVFDSTTVSSMLRYGGSALDQANRLVEDTVQNELSETVRSQYGTRPLGVGTVVVTSSGSPNSALVTRNEARYIFHTATVSVQGDGPHKRVGAIQSDQVMKDAVRNTLETVETVNERSGVVSPEGSPARRRQEAEKAPGEYEPLQSIVLPIFGTGDGGRQVHSVAPLIARSIHEYVLDHPDTSLKRIYVSAYFRDDVEIVAEALRAEFAPGEGESGS